MVDFYLMVSYASVPTTSSSTHAGPWVIDLVLFNAKRHPDLPAVSGKKFFVIPKSIKEKLRLSGII